MILQVIYGTISQGNSTGSKAGRRVMVHIISMNGSRGNGALALLLFCLFRHCSYNNRWGKNPVCTLRNAFTKQGMHFQAHEDTMELTIQFNSKGFTGYQACRKGKNCFRNEPQVSGSFESLPAFRSKIVGSQMALSCALQLSSVSTLLYYFVIHHLKAQTPSLHL